MSYELVEYRETFGPVRWQAGFEEELKGLSIEAQAGLYAWSKRAILAKEDVSYKDIEALVESGEISRDALEPIQKDQRLIVRDGLVVGVALDEWKFDLETVQCTRHDLYILPYGRYVYNHTSDNNGAGYKETDWYKYLVCLPAGHELWKE